MRKDKKLNRDKPYIIAEIGSNWKEKNRKSSLDNCFQCIVLAKNCGASAAKFQYFSAKALYGREDVQGYDPTFELPKQFLPKLDEYAKEIGIDLIITAFCPQDLKLIGPYTKFNKIASSSVDNQEYVDSVRNMGKRFFWSTGMFPACSRAGVGNMDIPLICASKYPARIWDYDFNRIARTASYRDEWGLSDHTLDFDLALICRSMGASFFEKHFNPLGFKTPDSCVSIGKYEFADYCNVVYEMEIDHPQKVMDEARARYGDQFDIELKRYVRPLPKA